MIGLQHKIVCGLYTACASTYDMTKCNCILHYTCITAARCISCCICASSDAAFGGEVTTKSRGAPARRSINKKVAKTCQGGSDEETVSVSQFSQNCAERLLHTDCSLPHPLKTVSTAVGRVIYRSNKNGRSHPSSAPSLRTPS